MADPREADAWRLCRGGAWLAAAGTHPFTSYLDRVLTHAPRYTELVDRNQWIARRLVIFGLHVHNGMPNAEASIHVMNAFLYHLPLLLGLSASSPFWHGDDTGLASSRSTFFEYGVQFLGNEARLPRVDDVFATAKAAGDALTQA